MLFVELCGRLTNFHVHKNQIFCPLQIVCDTVAHALVYQMFHFFDILPNVLHLSLLLLELLCSTCF